MFGTLNLTSVIRQFLQLPPCQHAVGSQSITERCFKMGHVSPLLKTCTRFHFTQTKSPSPHSAHGTAPDLDTPWHQASLVSWLCLEGATPSGHPSFAPDGLSLSRQSLSADAQWGDSQPIKSAPRSSVQSLQSIQLNPETGQSINSSHLLLRIVGGCSLWIILTVSVVVEGHRSYPHMEEGTRDP